ncbi:unnamed protein product [Rotaria magnacalcarata]|uniref:Uncharacterized protein n=1 Tax=Rotaria magnacalcarata TaxID=392030 RepID=A0A816YM26_9BILA|nr:unnamed protein product [Rotaria magnacalcarata]CAF1678051.1 unnamed protein product [Rotaria magnacalcarata]CAF2128059.1 unnamed protein product [Rotaria magnacalcarata]CAF2162239.1 unnamed protein product [Rotaria magnacalcarata]CAF2256650.1 unnamed protein product [Rotaria magnacalcarata]
MRLLTRLAFVLASIYFVQCQLIVPQLSSLNLLNSLRPQIQNFLDKLEDILPQYLGTISSVELQTLEDKLIQVVLGQLGGNLNFNALKDKLRPVLQQFLNTKPQIRFDFDTLLSHVSNAALTELPAIILSVLSGKREVTDARFGLDDVLALADKLPLSTYLPQIQQFLSSDKFEQLQNQFLSIVLAAVGNKWDVAPLAQALQQLFTQFVPQTAQMRVDWDHLAQQAINGLASAAPSIIAIALGFIGKREVRVNYQELLSQLSIDKLAQIFEVINSVDKSKVFAQLRKLLQNLFQTYLGRVNFDEMAASLMNQLNGLLPALSQSLFSMIG